MWLWRLPNKKTQNCNILPNISANWLVMAGLVASKVRRARDKELKDAKDGDDKESEKKCRNSI